jgi:hypothetical protein
VRVGACPELGGGALDRTRSAHDFGGAGGEAGLEVCSESVGDCSATCGADASDRLRSAPFSELSLGTDSFDVTETLESRCGFREAAGLMGKIGIAGMIGATGLLFG